MSGFEFAESNWVHLLWIVAAATALLFWLDARGRDAVGRLVAAGLEASLVDRPGRGRRAAHLLLLGLSAALLAVALMRPQWGVQFLSTPRVGAEIMICLDVSRSMLAEDVVPNRLGRSKAEIRDLLTYLDGDQVGLIAFAGRATVLSPLTPDFSFLRLVLDEAGPQSVTRGGTRLEEPLRKALDGFGGSGDVSRSILLITDGEDHDSFPLEAAKVAAERGVKVLAIGFGDEAGSEIRITDPKTGARTALRDGDGKVVRTRLDGELLREIALMTGGAYVPAGTGVLDLEAIYERYVAGLTRGRFDGQERTVKNDAFQWAVLLALVALVASVVASGGRARALAVLLALSLVSPTSPATATPAPAQMGPALARTALLGTLGQVEDQDASGDDDSAAVEVEADQADDLEAGDGEGGDAEAETPSEAEPELTPRERYNLALANLDSDEFDAASRAFERARSEAGTDGETRYRATYNLGWTEVRRADAELETDPAGALEALERAADWFRAAVELRPDNEAARRNLELVLRRALALEDSLREADQRTLAERLDELAETQREYLASLRGVVDAAASAADPHAIAQQRRAFRSLSALALERLDETRELSEDAGHEHASLVSKPQEEATPEEHMRSVQLEGLLHHLHRAREHLGQTRSQLRRLEAEAAYRRANSSLTEIKRARDQLRDPIEVLGVLLTDAGELLQLAAIEAAFESVAEPPEGMTKPEWLSTKLLAENTDAIADRTAELHSTFEAVAAQPPPDPGDAGAADPKQLQLLDRVRRAEPALGAARTGFLDAADALEGERALPAMEPLRRAADKLAEARETFLDLPALVDLTYGEHTRAAGFLEPAEDGSTDEHAVREYAPAVAEIHDRNLGRAAKMAAMIEESLAGLPPLPESPDGIEPGSPEAEAIGERLRLEQADKELLVARAALGRAKDVVGVLAASEAPDGAAPQPSAPLVATRDAVAEASESLERLRRLFFSIIDHLRELAQRQLDTGDETEAIVALAGGAAEDEVAAKIGPLAPRQRELAARAAVIDAGLRREADAPPPPDPQGQPSEDPAERRERMLAAAGHVASAAAAMQSAGGAMDTSPIELTSVRSDQDLALAELAAALEILSPPPPPEEQEQDQGEQEEQPEQQEQGGGEEEPQPEPQPSDPSQVLQSVRDREAKRREERGEQQRQSYDPVDKDW